MTPSGVRTSDIRPLSSTTRPALCMYASSTCSPSSSPAGELLAELLVLVQAGAVHVRRPVRARELLLRVADQLAEAGVELHEVALKRERGHRHRRVVEALARRPRRRGRLVAVGIDPAGAGSQRRERAPGGVRLALRVDGQLARVAARGQRLLDVARSSAIALKACSTWLARPPIWLSSRVTGSRMSTTSCSTRSVRSSASSRSASGVTRPGRRGPEGHHDAGQRPVELDRVAVAVLGLEQLDHAGMPLLQQLLGLARGDGRRSGPTRTS